MFVGHADQHAGDVHRLLHLSTFKVVESRDVQWLGKSWGEHAGAKKINAVTDGSGNGKHVASKWMKKKIACCWISPFADWSKARVSGGKSLLVS
jgi:hypothetical protein